MKLNNLLTVNAHEERYYLKFSQDYYVTEFLYETNFVFERGKIYGLFCERGEGGGALSWLLAGREKVGEQKVNIYGKIYEGEQEVVEGWFLGDWIPNSKKPFSAQFNQVLFVKQKRKDREKLMNYFHLDRSLFKKRYQECGWKAWTMSAVLGYAYQKDVFGFPWLNTYNLKNIILNTPFFEIMKMLKDSGAIILLPSDNREILEAISDEIIELNNPRYKDFNRFEQYMKDYKEMKLGFQVQ